FPADEEELTAGTRALTQGRGADLVLELAGVAKTVQAGVTLTPTGGAPGLTGTVAPGANIAVDPEHGVRRALTIRGVHDYLPRDLAPALSSLAGPGREFPWASLVVAAYPLEQAEQAFAHAHRQPGVRVAVVPETRTQEGPRP